MGPDIRWVGTESGYGRDTEWSVVPVSIQDEDETAARSQQQAGTFRPEIDAMTKDLGSREKLFSAQELVWFPSEVDVSIRPGWFYHANQDSLVKTPEKLVDIYYNSVGRNSLLLLNLPPDKQGLINKNDVKSLMEMKKVIDETFRLNLIANAKIKSQRPISRREVKSLVDGNYDTYWLAKEKTPTIEIFMEGEKTFNRLSLQEKITVGQRVEKFKLEAKINGHWKQITEGTTIGYKRLLRFPEITSDQVRLTILQARENPALAEFGLYKSPDGF
jgi:alpha-L-fucosidase